MDEVEQVVAYAELTLMQATLPCRSSIDYLERCKSVILDLGVAL